MLTNEQKEQAKNYGASIKQKYLSNNDWEGSYKYLGKTEFALFFAFLVENGKLNFVFKQLNELYPFMFEYCDEKFISKLSIPNNIKFVDANTFPTTPIKELSFANNHSIRMFENAAFADMKNLKVIDLPDSLNIIPSNCFQGDVNLKYVFLPDSLKVIGKNAFVGCDENIELVANFRPDTKLKAPKESIEFLKSHLRFKHPQEEDEEDGLPFPA